MKENRFIPNRVYQFLLMIAATMALPGPFVLVLGDFIETRAGQTVLFCLLGVAFSLATYFINKHKGIPVRGYYTFQLHRLALSATIVLVLNVFVSLPFSTLFHADGDGHNDVWLWIGAIFIGPVVEECMFRGILLRGLLTRYKPVTAVLVSAILFGLIHVRLHQVVPATLLGLLFGIVFLKSRSLIHTILLHMLSNALIFCSVIFELRESYLNINLYLRCGLMLIGVALATFLTIRLVRALDKYGHKKIDTR